MSKAAKILFVCVYLLVAIGIVMTYSASAIYASYVYKNPQYFVIRQLIFIGIGTLALFVIAAVPVSFWRYQARAIILLSIALLMLVLIPGVGHVAGGARRWMKLGGLNFQPIELAKIVICVYLADYLSRKNKVIKKKSIFVFFPPLVLIGMICSLSLLQPDLGSVAFILLIVGIIFFVAGLPTRYILLGILIALPVVYFLVIRVPYRLSRVTAYINPWDDPLGSGFQMIQSFIAFGLGGLHGVGLGQSTQKLFYLPSAYNDFIFAVISEELGLIGALIIIALFMTIFFCGVYMAGHTSDLYEKLLIQGLVFSIVVQALMNMMVATGLMPTKGLPLPFVSYGGTSMVMHLAGVGLLMGLDMQRYGKNRS